MDTPPRTRRSRRGAILVLFALTLVLTAGLIAFVVDLGYITVVRTQAQAVADAAALAGARGLTVSAAQVLTLANSCAQMNVANNLPVTLQSSDVVLGTWSTTTRTFTPTSGSLVGGTNALQVTVNLTAARGNAVSLFFGNILGYPAADVTATSIAGVKRWDIVIAQDISGSYASDITYAVSGAQTLLADFNQYSPTSDFGMSQFQGWGSTWVSLQPVGANYATLKTTVGNLKDCTSSGTLNNVYGGTTTSIAQTTITPSCQSGTDIATGLQQALNMLTSPIYTASIPPQTSRAIILSSDGESNATAYGQHPTPTYTDAQLDTLAQTTASAAWAQGISVYVILYYHGSDTTNDITLLQSLVRGQGTYTQVTDPTKLPASINQLYLNNLKYEIYR